jgi:transcription elongation factor Elf1
MKGRKKMKSDRVVCPYCEDDITDFYTNKYIDDDGNLTCVVCGGKMSVDCKVDIEYTTTPIFDED